MPLLNLHAHTNYSDGASFESMVRKAKQLGFVAFVSSDHDYMTMTPERYEEQLLHAQDLSQKYQVPVICGLEISLFHEEAVLIGTEACRAWLKVQDSISLRIDPDRSLLHYGNMLRTVGSFSHGLCLVHPSGQHPDEAVYRQMHCFEVMNNGRPWPEHMVRRLQALMPTAKQVRGCDAHGTMSLECPCNEVPEGTWNEETIIQWMRS